MFERALAFATVVCLVLGAGLLLKRDGSDGQEARPEPATGDLAPEAAPPRPEDPPPPEDDDDAEDRDEDERDADQAKAKKGKGHGKGRGR